jgi:hypothetical protein
MTFRHLLSLSALSVTLLFSSCAAKLSPEQRAGLSSVTVAKTAIGEGAYEDPYGGDVASRDMVASQGLIGLAVGSAISGTQNNMFKGKNQGYFAAVRKNTPADLGDMLNHQLKNSLAGDPFFKSRLAAKSENAFTSEITTHRLFRVGKNDNGDLLFAAEIYADIYLKDKAGKVLAGGSYHGSGPAGLTVAECAASAPRIKAAYSIATSNAVTAFMAELAVRTRE